MSSNNGLTKAYIAEAACGPNLIMKFSATTDYNVLPSAAATDKLIGVTTADASAAILDRVDVIHEGVADLKLGGTVARGDALTSDASGQGITTVTAGNRAIGYAVIAGVAGDIIPCLLNLHTV